MRRFAVLALLLAACASARPPVAEPEIVIEQLSRVVPAAEHGIGPVTLQYRVTIHNVADKPITLKHIDLGTVGEGAYTLPSSSRTFDLLIGPGQTQSVTFYLTGSVTDPTIIGANGPVTLRAVVGFDSPVGSFQTVHTQQVHENLAG